MNLSNHIHIAKSKLILNALFCKLVLLVFLMMTTFACEDDPKAPTAIISKIETQVPVRDWFNLSGQESINPSGDPIDLQYKWTLTLKPNGSEANFNDSTLMTPAIYLDLIGLYEISLVVKKGSLSSAEVRVQITAGPCGAQAPVIGDLNLYPTMPNVGSLIELFAPVQDPDLSTECGGMGESMDVFSVGSAPFMINRSQYDLSYDWKLLSRPVGSQADLMDSLLATPYFVPDISGTYLIELEVTDENGDRSEPKRYEVQVGVCGEGKPVIEQITASTMSPRIAEPILLTPTVTDADENCGQIQSFSYQWRLINVPAGSLSTLNDFSLPAPSFTADLPGTYEIELIVTDQSNRSSLPFKLEMKISACGSRIPEISGINIPSEIKTGDVIGLSAIVMDGDMTDENCPIDQQLFYDWQLTSLAIGSQATLNQSRIINPSILVDVPGEYTVRLQVTDAQGHRSMPYDQTFTVDPCGSFAPTGEISFLPNLPTVGSVVALAIDIQDEDQNCGLLPSHHVSWQLQAVPAGSQAMLTDRNALTPSFIADLAGDYELSVLITDDRGLSTQVSKRINVSICGGQAPVIQSVSHSPQQSGVGQQIVVSVIANDPDQDEACVILEQNQQDQHQALRYHWRLVQAPAGGVFEISDTRDQLSTFTFSPTRSGLYRFEIIAEDETHLQSTTFVYEIEVSRCGEAIPEIIEITSSASNPRPNQAIQLSAQISDADESCGDQANYHYDWSFRETPIGSIVALSNPQQSAPSFVPDRSGRYVVRCVIRDLRGLESFKDIEINVGTCGTHAPVIEAVDFEMMPQSLDPAHLPFVGSTLQVQPLITDIDQSTEDCQIDDRLTYTWTLLVKPIGSLSRLSSSQERTPSFVADMPGNYTIRLIVQDAQGLESVAFDQEIQVDVCGSRAPTASASYAPNQPKAGDLIALTLEASDLDETCITPILSYEWQLIEMPAGSRAVINQPHALTPSLIADLPGLYRVMAIVTDETLRRSIPEILDINVSTCGSHIPQIDHTLITHAPTSINAGQKVSFDASQAITDEDTNCGITESYQYQWSLSQAPAGSLAFLSLADTVRPSLTADLPGDYTLDLTVMDHRGFESTKASYQFSVGSCGLAIPVVQATTLQTQPSTGELVALSAIVTDADTVAPCQETESFTYLWSFDQVPAGSMARLNVPQAQTPSFVADVSGVYVLRLVAFDTKGNQSKADTLTITANPCGSNPPQIDQIITTTAQIRVGNPVALQVIASDADSQVGCGLNQTLSYQWTIIQAPAGSTATLLNANTAQPSLIPNVAGPIQVQAQVTDSTGLSTTQNHLITVNACGVQAPEVSAQSSVTSTNVGSTIDLSATVTDLDQLAPCLLDQTFRYTWTLISRPIGSMAEIEGNGFANARLQTDASGDYLVSVIASDSEGLVSNELILNRITATSCGSATPVISQIATTPASLVLGRSIQLIPTITDTDSIAPCSLAQTFQYEWTIKQLPIGSQVALNQNDIEMPSFTPDLAGNYVFVLKVRDQSGRTASFEKTVVLGTCGLQAPVAVIQMTAPANLPSNSNVARGNLVQLSAINSNDPDSTCGVQQTLSYHWSLLRIPAGSTAQLSLSEGQTPWFTIDSLGTYVIRLIVSDGLFNSTAVDFTITGI